MKIEILNIAFTKEVKPIVETENAKIFEMSILNVEGETVDWIRSISFSQEHNGAEELIEPQKGFMVCQFDIGEVEKRNKAP